MLLIIVGALMCVLIAIYLRKTFTHWEKLNIEPYPSPSLIYGHMQDKFAEGMINMYQYFKTKGLKFGGFYFFHQPIFMPTDLDFIKQMLLKDFDYFTEKGLYMNVNDQPINKHMFLLGGEEWKRIRVKVTPTFTSGKLKYMFNTMMKCAEPLREKVEELTSKDLEIDVKDVASRFTTDVIGSCAFGVDCNSFKDLNSEFQKMGMKLFSPNTFNLFKRAMGISFPKLCRRLGMIIVPRDIEEFYTNITQNTIKMREEHKIKRNDFLQLLMELRNKENINERVNLQDIINQSFVFYAAGFETSSSVMTFALLELAYNSEIQDKVREEIQEVLKNHNNEITYEAVQEMKYLAQVVDETLRKYPPVLMLNRESTKDYQIPDTNITLPAETKVFIPVMAIHHDEEFYPNPDEFDPDRFTDDNKKSRHQYAFLPFGEGPRQCIGLRFGYLQAKIGLITLIKHFKFSLHSSVKYPVVFHKTFLALTPQDTILLKTTPICT